MSAWRSHARPLLIRAYSTKYTHRLMPAAVALPLVAALQPPLRRLTIPEEDIGAQRMMTDLLAHTPRAGQAKKMARRFLRERARSRELFWRPWLLDKSRIIGRENWEAAHADGPCVVVLAHMGQSWAVPPIMARNGMYMHLVTSAHFWGEMPEGVTGYAYRYLLVEYGDKALGPGRLVPNDADPEVLTSLIEQGNTVGIAFDVPGSASVPFLGRPVALTGSPATLAFQTGVKVLPMITERHGTRVDLRVLTPIDPADYRDLRSLRAAIARVYEPFIVAKPQIVEVAWYPLPLVTEALTSQAPSAPEITA